MTDEAPEPATEQENQPAQPAPETPPQAEAIEKTHFQLVFTKYDDGDAMYRAGVPSQDPAALTDEAIQLLRRFDVHEVFLVTVHASYGKEILIKRKL